MSGPNNNNNNNNGINQGLTGGLNPLSGLALNTPPGNFDPLTLQQSIIAHVRARQAVPVLDTGANYSEVVLGWAEALSDVQNPLNSIFYTNDQLLFDQISQGNGGGGAVSTPTLLFNIVSGSLPVGSWAYQSGADSAAAASSSLVATGPAIGVVVEVPTATTARVQGVGSFLYDVSSTLPFLPLVPDSVYYVGTAAGEISPTPSPPSGGFIQEIGYAKTQYELVLNIQEPTFV